MNQKNIDVINICLDAMLAFGNEKSKADIKGAKEAFEIVAGKQIPKKVTETYEVSTNYIYGTYGECPNCGHTGLRQGTEHCWWCGQKLDWEGE